MIKTKIVATLGPASAKQDVINALIDNGVDVFRLNFSHGTLDGHAETLSLLNKARADHPHTTAVMGDLCGPKIRTGLIDTENARLSEGDNITIVRGDEPGTSKKFGTNYPGFVDDVNLGQRIFIDDGQIALRVTNSGKDSVQCEVLTGGILRSHKGINLPDTNVSISSITERDWQCVDWAIEHDLDFLAMSFVRSADDILTLRDYLKQADSEIRIVSKIETPQAIKDLNRIVQASDAVLVARGDLGVEMDLAEVPLLQKRMTAMCRDFGKSVIVATQMLQSMIESPVPTRAEVSDVANAIMDVTDAVMLSGETAVGNYPVEAAKTIRRIAAVTETYLDENVNIHPKIETSPELAITGSIARSVAQIVDDIKATLVAVWSQSGSTARLLSKARIDVPILAFSSDRKIVRQMCLQYGVIPRCREIPENFELFTQMADEIILSRKWASVGDKVVFVAGHPLGRAEMTNAVLIHEITSES